MDAGESNVVDGSQINLLCRALNVKLTTIKKATDEEIVRTYGSVTPTTRCLTALKKNVVELYCRNCKSMPKKHEYVVGDDAFICLECGELKHF